MLEEIRKGNPEAKITILIATGCHRGTTKEELISKLYIAIGQFAKRQETWFRRMEKQGVKINWLPFDGTEEARTVAWRKQKSIELIFNHNER
jgi:tRNA dimethylallyltransferase